jgi:hypothetical protein
MFIDVFIYYHPHVGASADKGVVHYHQNWDFTGRPVAGRPQ